MKVIDLLNKIANGEEVPEKFRFAGQIFEKQGDYIEDEEGDSIFDSMCTDFSNINEEVEIIEEDKKIEKIDLSEWAEITYSEDWEMLTKDFNRNCNLFVKKINKIIDYLEEKEQ